MLRVAAIAKRQFLEPLAPDKFDIAKRSGDFQSPMVFFWLAIRLNGHR